MNSKPNFKAAAMARTLAIGLVAATLVSAPVQPVAAQATQNASSSIDLSVGRGRLVSLPASMSDIFVANSDIADVQVRSPTQLWVFGKKAGETTLYATTRSGKVVYSATVRIGNNFASVDSMVALSVSAGAAASDESSIASAPRTFS